MSAQQRLQELGGAFSASSDEALNEITVKGKNFADAWRSKASEAIGIDAEKKEQIDELVENTGLAFTLANAGAKKVAAYRAGQLGTSSSANATGAASKGTETAEGAEGAESAEAGGEAAQGALTGSIQAGGGAVATPAPTIGVDADEGVEGASEGAEIGAGVSEGAEAAEIGVGAAEVAGVGLGATALAVLGPVGIAVGVGLGLYDLFHKEAAHDPPPPPSISTTMSRASGILPSANNIVDTPAGMSAF